MSVFERQINTAIIAELMSGNCDRQEMIAVLATNISVLAHWGKPQDPRHSAGERAPSAEPSRPAAPPESDDGFEGRDVVNR